MFDIPGRQTCAASTASKPARHPSPANSRDAHFQANIIVDIHCLQTRATLTWRHPLFSGGQRRAAPLLDFLLDLPTKVIHFLLNAPYKAATCGLDPARLHFDSSQIPILTDPEYREWTHPTSTASKLARRPPPPNSRDIHCIQTRAELAERKPKP